MGMKNRLNRVVFGNEGMKAGSGMNNKTFYKRLLN